MLRINGVTSGYGELQVINGVDLEIQTDEITALIGPNGSGKSTLLKTIYGFIRARGGGIEFQGNNLIGCRPEELIRRGILFVQQERSIFPFLTVEENLAMGAYIIRDREIVKRKLELVFDKFPILKQRRRQIAGSLSGGERRFVELARILMVEPKLALLDEPSIGVAPKVMAEIYKTISRLHNEGVGILLVEQNVQQALRIAHKVYVLRLGKIFWSGNPSELADNESLRSIYLGGG